MFIFSYNTLKTDLVVAQFWSEEAVRVAAVNYPHIIYFTASVEEIYDENDNNFGWVD